jgi:hypothetical protein
MQVDVYFRAINFIIPFEIIGFASEVISATSRSVGDPVLITNIVNFLGKVEGLVKFPNFLSLELDL